MVLQQYVSMAALEDPHNPEKIDRQITAITAFLGSICISTPSAYYLSGFFTGWPAQLAGGTVIWLFLSLLLAEVLIRLD